MTRRMCGTTLQASPSWKRQAVVWWTCTGRSSCLHTAASWRRTGGLLPLRWRCVRVWKERCGSCSVFVPMILPYLSELNSKYLSYLKLNAKADCSGFAVSAPFADPEPNRFTVNVSRFEENLDKSSMTPVFLRLVVHGLGGVCEGKRERKGLRGVRPTEGRIEWQCSRSCHWFFPSAVRYP